MNLLFSICATAMTTMIMPLPETITTEHQAMSRSQNLQEQIGQYKQQLTRCNKIYLEETTPVYQQPLLAHYTFSWLVATFSLGFIKSSSAPYNAEIILKECSQLADLVLSLEKIQENEKSQ